MSQNRDFDPMTEDLIDIVVQAKTRRISARWGFEVCADDAHAYDRRKDQERATFWRRLFG